MHICAVIKDKILSLLTERNKYVFKRDLDDVSDGAHQTSFGIEFQTEEARKNERSPRVALLCAGLLRSMSWSGVADVRRLFLQHDRTYDATVLLLQW